jgi:hypothetical protein
MASTWTIVNYTKICPLYKILHEQTELVRQQIFRDETNGDPLQKYIPDFSGTKGEAQPSTVAHVKTYGSMTS